MAKRLVVFGGSGLVGSGLIRQFEEKYRIIAPSHREVDVTSKDQVFNFLKEEHPDIVINSVGMARMEACEANPELAFLLNAGVNDHILSSLEGLKACYYYISTDGVFEGLAANTPFGELTKPNPISVYAKSKVRGEEIVLSSKNSCVIRITMPYTNKFNIRGDMVRNLLDSLKRGKKFTGIIDQSINPLFLMDVANAIYSIIEAQTRGIYHVAAANSITNYKFLTTIADMFELNKENIHQTTLQDFQKDKQAYRSNYCVLGVKKFNEDFYTLPTVEESLQKFANRFAF